MSSAVLIQQASGPARPLLELSARRHANYCARHGITYWPLIGDVQFKHAPHWNKIVLIRHALALGFETVAWLDADTLIVRDDEDLRRALNGGGPLALAEHPTPGLNGAPRHWNSGVMIMRNTPRTRAFFDAVWEAGPLERHRWHDQARILDLLPQFPGLVQRLDDRWNATYLVTDTERPIIKAWHGTRQAALPCLYGELQRLGDLDESAPAIDFVHQHNVHERIAHAIETLPPYQNTFDGRGIVICGGGIGYFTCAWVCIRQLRRLGCTLPIQLWYLGRREMDVHLRSLVAPYGVECVDALEMRTKHPARRLNGWELKPYSILHSPFREVLLLDSDNVATVNPEFLFNTPQFRELGAIFWPDYGRMGPHRTPWELFQVPYRDEPEFESGQIVVNKERCWRALNLAMWFNNYSDFFYDHVWGDKDTFRFAWHRLEHRFAMPPFEIEKLPDTMCQHDFEGRRVFQHRNMDKWNFYRDNQQIPGFLFEDECQADVRELRALWDGAVKSEDVASLMFEMPRSC